MTPSTKTYIGRSGPLYRSGAYIHEREINRTAHDYARQLSYLSDASTIRARVLEYYDRAPSIQQIEALRQERLETRAVFRRAADALTPCGDPDYCVQGYAISKPEPKTQIDDSPVVVIPDIITGPGQIIGLVAAEFRLTPADITGPSRLKKFTPARFTAAYILHRRGNSYSQIGNWLNRDHSTIIHAVRQFEWSATTRMREIAARYFKGDGA